MSRQDIHLGLVEMGDRLEISRAVAVLDKESLVVFKAIGCPDHGIIQTVSVEVLDGLADALLVGRGGNALQILLERQSRFLDVAAR